MSVLESVLTIFFSCFVCQVLSFRILNPKRPYLFLAAFFLTFLMVAISFNFNSWSVAKTVHFSLFYLSLFGTYMVTFLNTKELGPSFLMLFYLEKHSDVRKEDFFKVVTKESLLFQRMGEMTKARIVELRNDRYEITPYGLKYLWFYTFYRKLLGLRHRGG